MSKTVVLAILCLAAAIPGRAFAVDSSDLTGHWTITWLANNTTNGVTLKAKGSRLSGNYINDDGASCPVHGTVYALKNVVTIQVACPRWDIRMEGQSQPDGRTISGTYRAYADAAGDFQMEKNR